MADRYLQRRTYSRPAGETPVAPSALSGFAKYLSKEMDLNDIEDLVEAFGQAALRGKSAGFDGIQIHAAHGYLLNEFLSPVFNKRKDQYGGSIENRAYILIEILRESEGSSLLWESEGSGVRGVKSTFDPY